MSHAFIEEFKDRRRQVRHYLAIVIAAERSIAIGSSKARDRRLLTLRAGTFLLLYNLIEATIRGAIDAIHDHIITQKISFTELTIELRQEVILRFVQVAKPDKNHTMNDFPIEFVSVALDQGVKFSGNVDARLIRKLASTYGFSTETVKSLTWDGNDLLVIKDIRNDLSHGIKAYEEVGRDYPAKELLYISRRALTYVFSIIENIEKYIAGQQYLENTNLATDIADMPDDFFADRKAKSGGDRITNEAPD